MKPLQLDNTSKATVGRFVWKCYLSCAVALLSQPNYLSAASKCFLLYGALMIMVAVLTGQRIKADSLNHWSEALWLAFVAAGLHLIA